MNRLEKNQNSVPRFWRHQITPLKAILWTMSILGFLWLTLSMVFEPGLLGAVIHLVVGWFYFIRRILPLVQLNAGIMNSAMLALFVVIVVLHRVITGLHSKNPCDHRWFIRHTMAIITLTLALFGAAIAVTAVGHQSAWLRREPLLFQSRGDMRMLSNAHSLCIALKAWAGDHDGQYPSSLQQLSPHYLNQDAFTKSIFWSATPDGEPEPLVYLGGTLRESDSRDLPLLVSPRPFGSGRYLLARGDGAARAVSPELYRQSMENWHAQTAEFLQPK
jgi:hypothetical protein